jgi:3-deoxy-7-phosphoheptulonate synthase
VPRTSDLNVHAYRPLPSPEELWRALPKTSAQDARVHQARRTIERILTGEDQRLLAIVGPCSVHDVNAGREFAERLSVLARELEDRVVVVMRVYFEKPRTVSGWQGLIFDPRLDGTGEIAHGLTIARRFLGEVLDLGLPTATEFLDSISPQYISDLICWTSIGARTSESQTHRQLASGLAMPVGCKNGTSGSIQSAVNAIKSAAEPHTFFGVGPDGRAAAVHTRGNPHGHLVLRGGVNGPNYSGLHLMAAEAALTAAGVSRAIVVDCSHDNSGKQPHRQPEIARQVVAQRCDHARSVVGLMIESNLFAGNQPLTTPRQPLRHGVSITDACLDWDSTERCLRETHAALSRDRAKPRPRREQSSPVLAESPLL